MRMTAVRFHRLLALLASACLAGAAGAQDTARDLPPPTQLKDLDYGDVLFYFFQDDYFDSLVRLEVSRDFQRIPHHEAEAELLSGGLYLFLTRDFDRQAEYQLVARSPINTIDTRVTAPSSPVGGR